MKGQDHAREFKIGCHLGRHQCIGDGTTKKEAKQVAAQAMLKLIETDYDDELVSNASGESSRKSAAPVPIQENQWVDTIYITKLVNICQENLLKLPTYVVSFNFVYNVNWTFQLMHFILI